MLVLLRLDNPLNGAHGHWRGSARKRRAQREALHWAWLHEHLPRKLEPGQRVLITRIGPRRLDSDNLQAACKSVRDQAAQMLGINDALDVWLYAQETGVYGVRVEIVDG